MFSLKIHTVDFPQHLNTTVASTTSAAVENLYNLKPAELRGVAHLFRELSHTPTDNILANPNARSTLLFVVAVPNYFSPDDFLLFCVSDLPKFTEILFIRNDGVEDRYSVLIRLENQFSAAGFYLNFNGKKFKPSEVEVCHMYFAQSVLYTTSAEIATTPPSGFAELPTCPVCLERLDYDTSGIQSTMCDHSFQFSCVSKWTHLSCLVCRLCQQQDEKPACAVCGNLNNLWVCLICGFIGCGRFEKGHAIGHWSDKQHCFTLEVEKQQIWDYVGERYVHRLNQSKGVGKSVMINSECNSIGERGTCGCDGGEELDGALFGSKVEVILDEYNHLLASQLEIQRKHYESLFAEAKSRKESSIAKAVEKAIFSRTHDLQDKLRNQGLMKEQELLQKKFKEIEERDRLSLKSEEEKVIDLQEQIRDLKIYVEAQRIVANMNDSDSIKGGTVLPVESTQSSSGNRRRQTKPADMVDVMRFVVSYDGTFVNINEDWKWLGNRTTSIVVRRDIEYEELVHNLFEKLNVDKMKFRIQLKFKVPNMHVPPVDVVDDETLQWYISVRTQSALCVIRDEYDAESTK